MSKITKNSHNCDINVNYEHYEQDYRQNLCALIEANKRDELCQRALKGDLRNSKFRSLYWAVFLEVLTGNDPSEWKEQRANHRANYDQLKLKFASNPRYKIVQNDNPLSQEEDSVWNQHFCDQELLSVIQQDVVRTFPGIEFFRKPKIQELMTNILFVFARAHPQMVYMQGFHEVIAFIIFVVHCDQQAFVHVKSHSIIGDPELSYLMSPEHLEADCYELFIKIMEGIKCYYRVSGIHPLPTGHFPNCPEVYAGNSEAKKAGEYEVIKQLETIKSKLLLKEDLHLHNHLLKHEIPLSLFGIRWLRLLFGREFPLDDLLIVWDAIFSINNNFGLVNYLCVAMLIRIRHKLLYSDYTTTLTHLMKYPADVDVNLIIRHALYMYDSTTYERPEGIFVYSPTNNKVPPNRMERRKNNHSVAGVHRRRSTEQTDTMSVQVKSAKDVLNKASEMHNIDNDSPIQDGYAENDPEVYQLELQHKNEIMSVARNKLLEYVGVLRSNLPHNSNDNVYKAVDGIEEVCLLLQPKPVNAFVPAIPVEKAFEADESPMRTHFIPMPLSVAHQMRRQSATTYLNYNQKPPPPKMQELKSLTLMNSDVNIEDLPKVDPTMERRDSV